MDERELKFCIEKLMGERTLDGLDFTWKDFCADILQMELAGGPEEGEREGKSHK